MAELHRVDGRAIVDYTGRDYESLLRSMRELVPDRLPEWRDFENEADFGNVLLQLFAHIGDILSFYQDRVANESFLSTARSRRSVIEHLRLIGYELGTAVPAAARLSLAVPANVVARVTVRRGDAFATRSERDRSSVRFEYTGEAPLTIDFAEAEVDPTTGRRVFSGLPVEEGRLFAGELLGVSDGSANQRFPLPHPGLILRRTGAARTARDLTVVTELTGGVVEQWTLRETLAFSEAGQRDVVVRVDADDRATVEFGDGDFGARPPRGAAVRASYRVGGGAAGNVPNGAITTILDAPRLALLGATVTNVEPATGGAERETAEHAVRHAPAVFRSLRRAVTAADYEQLALSYTGVAKVRAVAGGFNQVRLYVAPEGGGDVSDVLETGLKSFFEDKRMLGQIVEVENVRYIPILVTAEIGVESFYVRSDVVSRVQRAAGALLAFDRVEFGQPVYLSRFYDESQSVPGVVFVNIVEFRRGDRSGPSLDEFGKIDLGVNEIPTIPTDPAYATGMKVVVVESSTPGGTT